MNPRNNAWRTSAVLGVANVRAAAEYYRDVLGFALDPVDGVFQPSAEEPQGVYAIVKRPGAWLHLQIRRGNIPQVERQSFERDVYFYVENVDALHNEFLQRGAKIFHPPKMTPHGIYEMVVEDLDGFRLAFGELKLPK